MFHFMCTHWKRRYLFLLFAIVLLCGCASQPTSQTPTSTAQQSSQTPTSTTNTAFASYVGTWALGNYATLQINANQTGVMTWYFGVASPSGKANITFTVSADGNINGTVQSVNYTQGNGTPVPAGFKPDSSDPQVGDTFQLQHKGPHMIIATWTRASLNSNSAVGHWCDSSVPDPAVCNDSSASSSPTPTATTPTTTHYGGDGYTISYSADWQFNDDQNGVVHLTLKNGDQTVSVSIKSGPAEADTPAGKETGEQARDFEFLMAAQAWTCTRSGSENIPATTTLAGDTWKQGGGVCNSNGTNIKGVVLGDLHTANSHIFIITLQAKASDYDQVYSTLFKPLLDTFRFA